MDSFAFIIHPIDPKKDVSRKFPFLGKILNERQIDFFSTFFPPVYISEITGICSQATGKEIKGWFIACPYTPRRMMELPERVVYNKIIQTGKLAEKLGAKILGLGAHTSVVGDAGITIARELDIPVTTGDAYTISIAMQAIKSAAGKMNISLPQATAAVLGANGAIGKVCSELLTGTVKRLYLIGRRMAPLEDLQKQLQSKHTETEIHAGTNLDILKHAELIVSVTSSLETLINPEHLQPGSVVCDVARPRDVSKIVAETRPDVLVLDGGMVDIPGNVNFNFDFGFPPGKAYACMAETMALALEGKFVDFTIGKDIRISQVQEIDSIAARHGFELSGFRSFEKSITPDEITETRLRARAANQPPSA